MSSRRDIGLAVASAGLFVATLVVMARSGSPQEASHGIGTVPSAAQIADRDITVFPDGRGLPVGRGTAREGRSVYAARCAACHGTHGEGTRGFPRLVGGRGTLASSNPVLTVGSYWPYATTLWDYNRRAMPYTWPGTLTVDEVYAVTAFVLFLNGIVPEDDVLDQQTLPLVTMPNRDGFMPDATPDVPRAR